MTWVPFFAARDDLVEFFGLVYAETDCHVFETYSRPDEPRRDFKDLESIASTRELGLWPGLHLALWSPSVGAAPQVRRIDFNPGAIPGHTHRFVTEGCSLVTVLTGGAHGHVVEASRLGWWTQASALRKASPQLEPESVDWARLAKLARQLRNHVDRRLKAATAAKKPVLRHAADYARRGYTLRDGSQPLERFTLDAV